MLREATTVQQKGRERLRNATAGIEPDIEKLAKRRKPSGRAANANIKEEHERKQVDQSQSCRCTTSTLRSKLLSRTDLGTEMARSSSYVSVLPEWK